MNEWSHLVWIALELMIASLVLTFGLYLAGLAREAGATEQGRLDTIEVAKEYREYNKYDNQQVNTQDIVALLTQYRNTLTVNVTTDLGTVSWPTTTNPLDYENTLINNKLQTQQLSSHVFHATVIKNLNGAWVGVNFVYQ